MMDGAAPFPVVMPGLDPGIQGGQTSIAPLLWIAGSGPEMTNKTTLKNKSVASLWSV